MTTSTVIWCLLGLLVLVAFQVLGQRYLHRRALAVAVAKTREALLEENERTFREGTRILTEQLAAVQIEVERAREIAEDERGRRVRYFKQIEVFEKQRNHWETAYFEQAAGHGNAQALMMTTIENLARALEAKGVRPKIPTVLHAVREEYLQTHELPAKEGLARLKAEAAAQAPVREGSGAPPADTDSHDPS